MKILLTPETWSLRLYEGSSISDRYKLSDYTIVVDNEGEILLLHTITWSIFVLTYDEFDEIINNQILRSYNVVVPEDLDELPIAERAYKLRMEKPELPNYDKITSLVLFTTTSCNARCFYCYEDGIKKETMSIKTASNVVKFISERRDPKVPFNIQWFGGEPLLNSRVIDYITDKLYELNINFRSNIITNAFLLEEEIIKKLDHWRIDRIQITLDGLYEDYNKIKNYIYTDVDAYLKVIDNIHKVLTNSKSNVSIRFNISNDNVFKLYDDILILKEEFKDHKNISYYAAPLFQYLSDPSSAVEGYWDEMDRLSTIVNIASIDPCDKMLIRDTYKRHRINEHCFAFSGTGVAVLPNGKFTPCEHVKDEDIFGDIKSGVTNNDVIKRWQSFDGPELNYCRVNKCPLHPLCPRFYKCNGSTICADELKRSSRLVLATKKLINTRDYYNSELRKRNNK